MTIRMDELIKSIATALDIVESELIGVSTNHGKRIAILCASMGEYFKMDEDSVSVLTTCGLLHDNALTEYILSERMGDKQEHNKRLHCEYGQRNVESLPFKKDVEGLILYHHECADGSGPYGKVEGEYPLGAELIAIADMLDVKYHFQRIKPEDLPSIKKLIAEKAGSQFTKRAVEAMLHVLDNDMLISLRDDMICEATAQAIPVWSIDIEDSAIIHIADFIARIIDYKSNFTKKHSTQIANRAWIMGKYYKFSEALQAQIYLAAALHDIGKLSTPTNILEKQGKLDDDEFIIIKEHVRSTYDLLKDIVGFEDICNWASSHHEKLDGNGYPFGKKGYELDFNSRLMACIDIYQAVSEERPYHARRSHIETMPILYDMAQKGLIDRGIVDDIDKVMLEYTNQDVPPPLIVD